MSRKSKTSSVPGAAEDAMSRSRRRFVSQFRFRMWKLDAAGAELETYRSEQHAIFFPPE